MKKKKAERSKILYKKTPFEQNFLEKLPTDLEDLRILKDKDVIIVQIISYIVNFPDQISPR